MKVYHQTGFRYQWNLESYQGGIGDGLIFSPINIDSDKLLGFPENVREQSFLDPQLYLISSEKSTLISYPFCPSNIKDGFSTEDLDLNNEYLAELCVNYQLKAGLKYVVIPTRYFDSLNVSYLEKMKQNFVLPFLDYRLKNNIHVPFLLTVVVKQQVLEDMQLSDSFLNWMTGIQGITGFYLIFEDNSPTKQIKDYSFLLSALNFITILKSNGFEVHIGYCNTEGLLYSAAMPDSITMGAYENLRMFKIERFDSGEKSQARSPKPRLYSSKLFQWIEVDYIKAMKQMFPQYEKIFDSTKYLPVILNLEEYSGTPEFNWHFTKSELYKHYFESFYMQCQQLPDNQKERIGFLQNAILSAINSFEKIKELILLDENSDGSHLPTWYNVLNTYKSTL